MDLKSKLLDQIESSQNNVTDTQTVQDIIQKTFLWTWGITFIVFAVWYYIVSLIKAWTISTWNYMVAFWASFIIGLILIFGITWWYTKMRYSTLAVLTLLFAVAEWIWLAWVLYAYNASSVINAFAWASILFIVLAIYGYTTKTDLTKLWSLFLVWLITIIILSLVNMFLLHSSQLEMILSIVWLVIFLWLVAWDMQILKIMAQSWDRRLEMVFWVSLYLDFINIFLELLKIFWNRND